jgi:hypothetical protein
LRTIIPDYSVVERRWRIIKPLIVFNYIHVLIMKLAREHHFVYTCNLSVTSVLIANQFQNNVDEDLYETSKPTASSSLRNFAVLPWQTLISNIAMFS